MISCGSNDGKDDDSWLISCDSDDGVVEGVDDGVDDGDGVNDDRDRVFEGVDEGIDDA